MYLVREGKCRLSNMPERLAPIQYRNARATASNMAKTDFLSQSQPFCEMKLIGDIIGSK